MLRLEASAFSAAEYDEPDRRPARPRSGAGSPGTAIGFALIAGDPVHPSGAARGLHARRRGDRRARRSSSASCTAAIGDARSRSASRCYRYRRLRFPDVWSYPGALLNAVSTAFIDEVTFRGALLGLLLATGPRTRRSPTSSRPSSTRWRRGSGRPVATATCSSWRSPSGSPAAGSRSSPAASPPRSSATRSRGSRSSSRPATPASSCRAAARRRRSRRSAGRRRAGASIGSRADRDGGVAGPVTRRVRREPRRRARPPVALYVHVPFCVSVCPYCDFVVVAGRGRARADATGSPRSWRPSGPSSACGPTRSTPDSVRRASAPGDRLDVGLPRRRHAVAAPGRRRSPGCSSWSGTRFGLGRRRRGHARGEPGPRRARRRARRSPRPGVTRISFGAQSLDAAELRRLGRRHRPADVADAVAAARAAGIGSINLDLLYDVPGQLARDLDRRRSTRRSRSARTTSRSTR